MVSEYPDHGGAAAAGGGGTTIAAVDTNIIQTHILSRLDAPTLAAAACTSPSFHALCMEDFLWRDISNSTWPSTKHPLVGQAMSKYSGGHRSFFSDSTFPIHHTGCSKLRRVFCRSPAEMPTSDELISAVDIHYKKRLVYTNVDAINTTSESFFCSDFLVKVLLDKKETVMLPEKFEGDDDMYFPELEKYMSLSWIIINPLLKRAVNLSSLRPVTVRPHWIGGDIELKYATILAGDYFAGTSELVEFRAVVMLGWKEGRELEVRGVKLEVKDMDNNYLSGKQSLGILHEAMQSGKRRKGKKGEEKERYRKFLNMKRNRRERKERRERRMKMVHKLAHAPSSVFIAMAIMACLVLLVLGLGKIMFLLSYACRY